MALHRVAHDSDDRTHCGVPLAELMMIVVAGPWGEQVVFCEETAPLEEQTLCVVCELEL